MIKETYHHVLKDSYSHIWSFWFVFQLGEYFNKRFVNYPSESFTFVQSMYSRNLGLGIFQVSNHDPVESTDLVRAPWWAGLMPAEMTGRAGNSAP